MKTNMKMTNWIVLMVFFSMIGTSIFAQQRNETLPPPPPPPVADQQNYPPPPPPPPLAIPGLTDVQQEKIHKADLKHLEAMTPLKNLVREKNAHLNTILTTFPVKLMEADKIADEIGGIHASILKLEIRHDQDIRAILNPDQQIMFDSNPKPFLGRRKVMKEWR